MGLADFFSILAFALIIIIFYFLFKFTLTGTNFPLPTYAANVQDTMSLQNILRTPLQVDNAEINVAQLIALSEVDSAKNDLLEKALIKIMEDSFGTSVCSMTCLNQRKIKGSGCKSLNVYICPSNIVSIPGYGGNPIPVSFGSDMQQLQSRQAPLK